MDTTPPRRRPRPPQTSGGAEGAGPPDLDGTGFETAEQLTETARSHGRDFGPARIAQRDALGRNAAPNRHIEGAVETRKTVARQDALAKEQAARTRVTTVRSRQREARETVRALRSTLADLKQQLTATQQRVRDRRDALDEAIDHWLLGMPRALRGYFEKRSAVAAVAVAVATFDAWVLHAALEYSGMSGSVVWGTTLSVPLLIIAINHGFGVLAGAIGLRTPPRRHLQLAVALLVAGFGAALVGFVLLMIFRVHAIDAQNATLRAFARGDAGAQLKFFISPLWLGPLQIAGSFAALSMTALWTMAKEGRDFRALVLDPLTLDWEEASTELSRLERRFAEKSEELQDAVLEEHRIETDGLAAGVEIEIARRQLEAALEAEDGLGKASQALYETTERYHDRIAENGRVWRVAMPTAFPRYGDPFTPGPRDVASEEPADRYPQRARATPPWRGRPNSNGRGRRRNIDPDQLKPL